MPVLNLKTIKTTTVIEIPDFDGLGTVEVEVRRPNLMKMLEYGEIENPLIGAAYSAINGRIITKKEENTEKEAKRTMEIANLYCATCLVNPSFEEFNEFMTDDQRLAVAAWGMSSADLLRRFHTKEKDSKNNTTK